MSDIIQGIINIIKSAFIVIGQSINKLFKASGKNNHHNSHH
jgi:hypothetical protein